MKARAASVLIAGVGALALAGCSFVTPIATEEKYDPSDGVGTTVGELTIRNAMLITEDGEIGNLVFTVVSDETTDTTLLLQYDTADGREDATVEAHARTATDIGYNDGAVLTLEGLDAQPGSLLSVYVQYGTHTGSELLVPVLDGSLPQYADLVP